MEHAFITTNENAIWPDSKKLVFVNDWLLPDDPQNYDLERFYVVPDLATRHELFTASEKIYEETLIELSDFLNNYHDLAKSIKYWEIVAGIWLRMFIDAIISRIYIVQNLKSRYSNLTMISSEESGTINCQENLAAFQTAMKSASWNSKQYLDIMSFESTNVRPQNIHIENTLNPSEGLSKKFGHAYISSSYLPRKLEFFLALRLKSLPHRISQPLALSSTIDFNARGHHLHSNNESDIFSTLSASLVLSNLPKSYLEDFKILRNHALTGFSSKIPRVIFTANRHLYDDSFNIWAGEMGEKGSKLVLAQHGGHFGSSLFPSFAERQEISISDRYITWGWSSNSKCYPTFVLTQAGKRPNHSVKGTKLIVVTDHAWSHPRSFFIDIAESGSYLRFMSEIVKGLSIQVQSETVLRLHHGQDETGKSHKKWWSSQAPRIVQDNGTAPFAKLLAKAKLVLTCHNGTTFPETISAGIPTVIAWNESFVYLRDEAQVVFDALEKVGVFHKDANSASKFINAIWHDVDGWWNSEDVMSARELFTNQFARTTKHPIKFMAKALRF